LRFPILSSFFAEAVYPEESALVVKSPDVERFLPSSSRGYQVIADRALSGSLVRLAARTLSVSCATPRM
jgi:hypothetical protein